MKRSKMIEIISDFVSERVSGYNASFSENAAEDLLDELERQGMLPPLVPTEYFGFESESMWEGEND